MGSGGHGAATLFLRLATTLILASGALAALGWFPTQNLGGASGIRAMLAGIGVSLAASLLGILPVLRSRSGGNASQEMVTLLGGTSLRMAVALGLSLVVVLGSEIARKPFLVWVGISYLALLPIDILLTLSATRSNDPRND